MVGSGDADVKAQFKLQPGEYLSQICLSAQRLRLHVMHSLLLLPSPNTVSNIRRQTMQRTSLGIVYHCAGTLPLLHIGWYGCMLPYQHEGVQDRCFCPHCAPDSCQKEPFQQLNCASIGCATRSSARKESLCSISRHVDPGQSLKNPNSRDNGQPH